MDLRKIPCFRDAPSVRVGAANFQHKSQAKCQIDYLEEQADCAPSMDIDIDVREIYFLIMHFLSSGPFQKTVEELSKELLEHELLPRRYHAWYSKNGALAGDEYVDGNSFPLNYDSLVGRYSHVGKDHLVRLLKQLILSTSPPLRSVGGRPAPSAADVPTLLGTGSFSLLSYERNGVNKKGRNVASYLRWPHMKADQFRGLTLREIGGGFSRHHRAPSIRLACYAIAKPSAMVLKMQNMKKLRGHRDAVYCAIFDRSGRYVITGSDDRLVKIWSMETAFCLASCRGHEGDITDLSVSLNNAVVASASNDFSIRVWRLPDGFPISVLRGHTGAVTAIAFSPRPSAVYQLLSSSDDGSCRVWDARYSQCHPRVYIPKPTDAATGTNAGLTSAGTSLGTALNHQILCCAFNANGTVFVTGSSDTYARVWIVSKPSTDDPEQPSHEIDILGGHENDVNYVQFSGCAVPSRSSLSDSITEDSTSKFKNSWYNHDNIVTCSRDGSAIIWIPRSRRYHGKVGRWIRAYHLKVPPPPMPPRPPRGGPRQRFLPTPRGVNMIVWSLDNRFVLAAIMEVFCGALNGKSIFTSRYPADNRICVWNANDGSLVHSLSGHTASTYVLDVHPFNPRIAMSAGYDGKTILWDIWEGTPIRVYDEIVGHLKMVDGRFSPDGTSIVLSDDVGQIYLLDTGEGEPQKDAKYDQFFLGDYRPLTQDTHGNIVDQETQLAPYVRNIQDPLCDSSLHPYPEPYQSVYQQRRLGALGIEWRPSSIKFAVGMDNGQGYQLLPLADPDVVLEPLPALVDTLWEPENDVLVDDSDSEYNAAEEYYSDQSCPSDSISIDVGSSEEDKGIRNKRDGRQLKRKKSRLEVEVVTSSGRRVKRKVLDEQEGTSSSRSTRHRRSKSGQNASQRKKSTKSKLSRPRRLGTRNVVGSFSQISETSADEDEDEDVSAEDTSDSELCLEGSPEHYSTGPNLSPGTSEVVKILNRPDSNINAGNKKKLVVRFSLHQRGAPTQSENQTGQLKSEARSGVNFRADEESPVDDRVNSGLGDLGSSSSSVVAKEASETCKIQSGDAEKPTEVANEPSESPIPSCSKASWGKLKIRMSHGSHQGALAQRNDNATKTNEGLPNEIEDNSLLSGTSHRHGCHQLDCDSGASVQQSLGVGKDSLSELRESSNPILEARDLSGQQNNSKKKPTVLKIKTKRTLGESSSKYLEKAVANASFGSLGESMCRKLSSVEENAALKLSLADSRQDRQKNTSHILVYDDEVYCDSNPNVSYHDQEREFESPYTAIDSGHRAAQARSSTLSIRTRNFDGNYIQSSTSRGVEKPSKKAVDYFPSGRSKSTRSKRGGSYRSDRSSLDEGNLHDSPRKQNSLLLEEQEDGYRYIPQLGDEVVYLQQGHQDYIELTQMKQPGPWRRYGDKVRAIEVCLVEDLKYGTWSGSGESCCHITLKFIDSRCAVVGQNFVLTLTELDDFPDFVVERTWYEASMERNWAMRDKCLVWWRDDIGQGGAWWEGRITAIKDKCSDFPGSPWERYLVKYKNDDTDYRRHCPWELHDPNKLWEPPTLELNTKLDIMNSLAELMQTANKDKDKYGIRKLNEVAQKTDFINRFPVPLHPELIKLRVEKNYYRNLKALKHDIDVMLSNAESYFQKHVEFLRKIKRLSNWFSKNITYL